MLTNDPIMNALFGGVVNRGWFCSSNNISSGGTDIASLTIRKTDREKECRQYLPLVNGTIMLIAGLTFLVGSMLLLYDYHLRYRVGVTDAVLY